PLMSCSARLPVYVLLIGAFLTHGFPWWVPGLTMFAMYSLGLVLAPLVALLLKRTLLRGETPLFVMEMPQYKRPSLRTVLGRMKDAAGSFLYRAGTMILASMIVVWALLYFPSTNSKGESYEDLLVKNQEAGEGGGAVAGGLTLDSLNDQANDLRGEWKKNSLLGQTGKLIEPAVEPLGWDWRIGMAALASFPAREVVVGTLGIIFNQGDVDTEEIRNAQDVAETGLGRALTDAKWGETERPLFTVPVALSL